jgi:hypothetical protein
MVRRVYVTIESVDRSIAIPACRIGIGHVKAAMTRWSPGDRVAATSTDITRRGLATLRQELTKKSLGHRQMDLDRSALIRSRPEYQRPDRSDRHHCVRRRGSGPPEPPQVRARDCPEECWAHVGGGG